MLYCRLFVLNDGFQNEMFRDDYAIGDTFDLKLGEESRSYQVVGFIQSVNNNGLIAELTEDGYELLSDTELSFLNIYFPEDRSDSQIASFVSEVEDKYEDDVVTVSNAAKDSQSMQMLYSSLITVVAVILFIITVQIVLLILYVILRSLITQRKTEFGIYKAMGFTSGQLIRQTVGSITPITLAAALLSAVLGVLYLPGLFNTIFGVIGAMKNNFEFPILLLVLMALILTVINVAIGVLLCRPIRKITAYSLIKE